jgi:probable F420-dependent oxidoreductase
VKIGVWTFPTAYSMHPVELGQALERLGFESLFVTEHTHIPASRQAKWPAGEGELPPEYWNTWDPFIALTAVAMATKRLVLGTGVCLVIQHDPIVLAKTVASLDVLSGGRLVFGVGGGWNWEEVANHGTVFKERWDVLRERVEAMKAIWTSEEASYSGDHVRFERIWQGPKPLQKPHPPILLGANGPGALGRIVDYCDGWIPSVVPPAELAGRMRELERLAAEAGRPKPPVTVFSCPETTEALAGHAEAGVERVLFKLPSEPANVILPHLERLAALAESVR